MNTAHADCPPAFALCKRWVATYTEFLFRRSTVRSRSGRRVAAGSAPRPGPGPGGPADRPGRLSCWRWDTGRTSGSPGRSRSCGARRSSWRAGCRGSPRRHDAPLEQVAEDVDRIRDAWAAVRGVRGRVARGLPRPPTVLNPQHLYSVDGVLVADGSAAAAGRRQRRAARPRRLAGPPALRASPLVGRGPHRPGGEARRRARSQTASAGGPCPSCIARRTAGSRPRPRSPAAPTPRNGRSTRWEVHIRTRGHDGSTQTVATLDHCPAASWVTVETLPMSDPSVCSIRVRENVPSALVVAVWPSAEGTPPNQTVSPAGASSITRPVNWYSPRVESGDREVHDHRRQVGRVPIAHSPDGQHGAGRLAGRRGQVRGRRVPGRLVLPVALGRQEGTRGGPVVEGLDGQPGAEARGRPLGPAPQLELGHESPVLRAIGSQAADRWARRERVPAVRTRTIEGDERNPTRTGEGGAKRVRGRPARSATGRRRAPSVRGACGGAVGTRGRRPGEAPRTRVLAEPGRVHSLPDGLRQTPDRLGPEAPGRVTCATA